MIFKDYKNISLSRLGMGNMRLPTINNEPRGQVDYERAEVMIDYAMKSRINYYDTAYVYHGGESEKFLGKTITKYPRESYNLATKFFIMATEDYKGVFEEQLKRLKTDYIDFYLIHGIFDNTWQRYIDSGCIPYLLEQKEKGRIKNLGFSSHAAFDNFSTFANYNPWDFAMIQLNCFDWIYGSAKKEYELLAEKQIPIIAMEPVRGGRLNFSPRAEAMLREAHKDWSNAAWALRWVKKLPGVNVVLSGMSTLEQVQENVSIFEHEESLTGEEEKLLLQACKTFKEEVSVPCTDCRYCCDPCPAGIEIPRILEVYNRYKTDGNWALQGLDQVDSKGKVQDCTSCGICNSHCPQGIDIKAIMKELADSRQSSS